METKIIFICEKCRSSFKFNPFKIKVGSKFQCPECRHYIHFYINEENMPDYIRIMKYLERKIVGKINNTDTDLLG